MEHMTYNEVKTELIFASYEGVKEGCRLLIRNLILHIKNYNYLNFKCYCAWKEVTSLRFTLEE